MCSRQNVRKHYPAPRPRRCRCRDVYTRKAVFEHAVQGFDQFEGFPAELEDPPGTDRINVIAADRNVSSPAWNRKAGPRQSAIRCTDPASTVTTEISAYDPNITVFADGHVRHTVKGPAAPFKVAVVALDAFV